MARPQKHTDEDYKTWIDAQISAGRSIKEITANELQQAVGGKYSRCQSILTAVRDARIEEEADPAPAMPVWFRDFVEQVAEQARRSAESQWMKVGRGINETIEDATAAFEDKKAELEVTSAAHMQKIEQLESDNEAVNDTLESVKAELINSDKALAVAQSKVDSQALELETLAEQLSELETTSEAEVARLNRKIAELETSLTSEKEARGTADKKASDATRRADQLESKLEELPELRKQLKEAEKERTKSERENERLKARLETAEGNVETLRNETKISRDEARDAVSAKARLEGQIESIERERERLANELSEIKNL